MTLTPYILKKDIIYGTSIVMLIAFSIYLYYCIKALQTVE